ncbi:MAG TPA: hypothetical protein VJ899_01490 [Salegentibacter sp.]|nr:hypothetical protein [Salegentibacter sp.]
MRNLLLIFFFATIASCSTTLSGPANLETKEITGKWQLTETLADPGDGSGSWRTVENGRVLEFGEDGMVFSSTSFCNGEEINEAAYEVSEKMISSNCADKIFTLRYELKEGSLFVYPHNPACIEACGSKYRKIED